MLKNNESTMTNDTNKDILEDTFLALVEECKTIPTRGNSYIPNFLQKYESIAQEIKGRRLSSEDFQLVKTISGGAFGTIALVRGKRDGKVYAMKSILKTDYWIKKETMRFLEERDIMIQGNEGTWLTRLYHCFHDESRLHYVMEYLPGGDLSMLIECSQEGKLSEDTARFYLAELVEAVAELHHLNYVHRDIKPSNVLIDKRGHIKLADFGSAIKLVDDCVVSSGCIIGTPDYISPEALMIQEGGVEYGKECDWWSVGITFYESCYGEPPFLADNLMDTYHRIMSHSSCLQFPSETVISNLGIDLMKRLICQRETRLGRYGSQQVKEHAYFEKISWNSLQMEKPPFVPELASDHDTSYFLIDDELEEEENEDLKTSRIGFKQKEWIGKHLPFVGFSYKHDSSKDEDLVLNKNDPFPDEKGFEGIYQKETEAKVGNQEILNGTPALVDDPPLKNISLSSSAISIVHPLRHFALQKLFQYDHLQKTKIISMKLKLNQLQEKLNDVNPSSTHLEPNPFPAIKQVQMLQDKLNHEISLRIQCMQENSQLKEQLGLKKLELSETIGKLSIQMQQTQGKKSVRQKMHTRSLEQQIDLLKQTVLKVQEENSILRQQKAFSLRDSLEVESSHPSQVVKRLFLPSLLSNRRLGKSKPSGKENKDFQSKHGWLKVCKISERNSKAEWKKLLVILEGHVLSIYAGEKQLKQKNPSVSFHLRSKLFSVNTVKAHEFIHCKSKVIQCMFKIRGIPETFDSNTTPSSSKNSTYEASVMSEEDMQRRIAHLEDEYNKEKKFEKGAEAMLKVSRSPAHMESLRQQLQAAKTNLLKLEKSMEMYRTKLRDGEDIVAEDESSNSLYIGHQFTKTCFAIPTLCHYCNEPFLGQKHQGMTCSECQFICHKNCASFVNLTCEEFAMISKLPYYYLMASSCTERDTWIDNLIKAKQCGYVDEVLYPSNTSCYSSETSAP